MLGQQFVVGLLLKCTRLDGVFYCIELFLVLSYHRCWWGVAGVLGRSKAARKLDVSGGTTKSCNGNEVPTIIHPEKRYNTDQ